MGLILNLSWTKLIELIKKIQLIWYRSSEMRLGPLSLKASTTGAYIISRDHSCRTDE